MIEIALLIACTNAVSPSTARAIIQTESAGSALAISANPHHSEIPKATNRQHAAEITERLMASGYSVDMGLMQINSMHLERFGLKPFDMFDPCTNIFIGTTILTEFYQKALNRGALEKDALRQSLSAYNTGSFIKGIANGYVQKVEKHAGIKPTYNDVDAARSPIRVDFGGQRIRWSDKRPGKNGSTHSNEPAEQPTGPDR